MARIDPANWQDDPSLLDLSTRIVAQRGQMGGLFALLLQSPPVAEGWLRMSAAVRLESSLPGDCRELAIIRVADSLGCELEVRAHGPFALKEGVTEAQLASLHDWHGSDIFSPQQRAVLAYTDTMTRDVHVPDPVFDELRVYFNDRQIVDLTITVGFYHLVARFVEAMQLS